MDIENVRDKVRSYNDGNYAQGYNSLAIVICIAVACPASDINFKDVIAEGILQLHEKVCRKPSADRLAGTSSQIMDVQIIYIRLPFRMEYLNM